MDTSNTLYISGFYLLITIIGYTIGSLWSDLIINDTLNHIDQEHKTKTKFIVALVVTIIALIFMICISKIFGKTVTV